MFQLSRLSILVVILACFLQAQGADKYTDENRPYEFGFTIEGEQHRHEKKTEDGLIEGEFGFITADGVYHVTVYATDENGNFKILSMKNIRVKPYPTAPERKGNSLPFPPSVKKPLTQGPELAPPLPVQSCSSCSIPSTTKAPALTDYAVVSQDNPSYNQPENQYPQNPQYPGKSQYPGNYPQNSQYPENSQNPRYPDNSQNPQYPDNSQNPQYPDNSQYPQENYPQDNYPGQPQDYPQTSQQYPQQPLQAGERDPKQINIPPQFTGQDPNKPILISAQIQVVDKNTDIYSKGPGEREGLPNGLNKGDMTLLLYTFNYTVGFHGHHEEGYTNGAKKGYYYVTGRNGVRTRIDYEADERGFRPKITQELLDLASEDVPKPETEKDEKYGLKGYEFKWLYYPTDSKRR
ncbi:protein lethal(3)malignant blood neoplasm 1 [Pectinophora gossypiella]|uniref:protein lethal(3)malignant blood neoplasm 1 n=1 Tax=Pectinophora gossypiella TaxID=13191 RepID=UPI00214E6905|nr:protein lethal(3)malignant blood neoplasm 1 [Pectinophora gossypiella]XP_049865942.1 protein lethal(3)malignant blood neoplasm 1 [Pectinophora gossypiella]